MAEVLVRHCRIRVVRRGGWSWGPEPRALLERVLKQVPDLLGAELEALLAEDGGEDREIAPPVRVVVPLCLSALRAAGSAAGPAPQALRELSARVGGALRKALVQAGVEIAAPDRAHDTAPQETDAPAHVPEAATADPLGVLVEQARRGRLQHYLSGFSLAALRAWHDWIEDDRPIAASIAGVEIAALEPLLARIAAHYAGVTADEAEILRRRLTAFAAVESTAPHALPLAAVRSAIERIAPSRASPPATPAPAAPQAASAGDIAAAQAAFETGTRPAQPHAGSVSPAAPRAGGDLDLKIESALPFLLLGPLARLGYLDAAAATFAAADALDDMPFFALALAYKTLSPPARGWLRSPSCRAAAAAFGLFAEPPADAMLAAMARRIGPFTSSLDGALATALVEGHRRGTPLLVTCAGPGRLLLSDVDGIFPIGSGTAQDLVLHLKHLLQDLVLVEASAASPETLEMFDQAGVRFVADTAPCRGESWRIVHGRPGEHWQSNDRSSADGSLASAARKLGAAAQDADEYWRAVGVERPSLPRGGEQACDDALTLAAGAALATIAWELWREREPTSPALALERFGDLDGRVRVDAARVRVSLPLGRRYRDLSAHGFLDDLRSVPWLGGRVLSFSSG